MTREHELAITGMTCGHCIRTVTRALQGASGVRDVKVDLSTGAARVTLDADSAVDAAALARLVEEEGYEAQPVR